MVQFNDFPNRWLTGDDGDVIILLWFYMMIMMMKSIVPRMNVVPSLKLTANVLKIDLLTQQERIVFQPSIFRGKLAVSFREGTLPKINSLPLKMVVSNRNFLFQGCIFRCENVSFREVIVCLYNLLMMLLWFYMMIMMMKKYSS